MDCSNIQIKQIPPNLLLNMKTVVVNDKTFEISISEATIAERVKAIATQINNDLEGKNPLFVVVLNGAFIFAADLLRNINIPCEVTFVKMASYTGTVSTGHVKEIVGLNTDVEGRTIVIVEDIVDSGLTMKEMLELLDKKHPAEVHVSTLLVKPNNLKAELDIKYCCFEIPNDFIVGYGLDYDGHGRNHRDIYTIVQ